MRPDALPHERPVLPTLPPVLPVPAPLSLARAALRAKAAVALLLVLWASGAAGNTSDDEAMSQMLQRGEATAALALADSSLKRGSSSVRLQFLRGVALMELRRDAAALEAFTLLAQEHPQLPEPYNNIAALQARAGQWELARQALETALRNDPAHAIARENLGDVHLQLALQAWRTARLPQPAPGDPALNRKIRVATALSELAPLRLGGGTEAAAARP
jgi:tetratricopeptide (TPR) repeat protein